MSIMWRGKGEGEGRRGKGSLVWIDLGENNLIRPNQITPLAKSSSFLSPIFLESSSPDPIGSKPHRFLVCRDSDTSPSSEL